MADEAPTRWQDVLCSKCQGIITDPTMAIIETDITTGGLKGMHKVCPADERPSDFILGFENCAAQVRAINPQIADQLVKPAQ